MIIASKNKTLAADSPDAAGSGARDELLDRFRALCPQSWKIKEVRRKNRTADPDNRRAIGFQTKGSHQAQIPQIRRDFENTLNTLSIRQVSSTSTIFKESRHKTPVVFVCTLNDVQLKAVADYWEQRQTILSEINLTLERLHAPYRCPILFQGETVPRKTGVNDSLADWVSKSRSHPLEKLRQSAKYLKHCHTLLEKLKSEETEGIESQKISLEYNFTSHYVTICYAEQMYQPFSQFIQDCLAKWNLKQQGFRFFPSEVDISFAELEMLDHSSAK